MPDEYQLPPLQSKGDARELVYSAHFHLDRLPDKTPREQRVIAWCGQLLFGKEKLYDYEGE